MTDGTPELSSITGLQTAMAHRYRFERLLGQGGMAMVYLAHDLVADRPVAVKVLRPELAASIGGERFLREIDVGRKLVHPHIVGVLDSGDAAGTLWYAMPFVDGASLRDRLRQRRQFGIDEAIAVIRQVAEALDFAHSKGVIHRDIKPENILLEGEKAYVADFGIARAVTVAGGETLTRTGMAVGTPTYMSPEQALGSHDVTPESDVYSLACVLYELLAGAPPFTAPTPVALLARHSLEHVPNLQIVRGTVPDAVEDAIEKAMEKIPADRYPTAGAFAKALDDHTGAAVRRHSGADEAHRVADAVGALRRAKRLRRSAMVGVSALAVAAIAGWLAFGRGGSARGLSGPGLDSIAVLYFDDRSPDQSLAYLSNGLTEALIHELTQVRSLHVISRNGVAPFKGNAVPADSISRALHVGTVVSGTVQGDKDTLRVTIELAEARSGRTFGTRELRRPKSESFELQDDLVREVSVFLRSKLGEQVQVVEARAGTRSAEAYEAFQRARQMVDEAERLTASGDAKTGSLMLSAADSAFAKVSQLDTKWARPLAARGWASYRQSRLLGVFDRAAYAKWTEVGLVHANAALALTPRDADALELRGTLSYWRWLLNLATGVDGAAKLLADAEADLAASTEVNPNQATAWNSLSHLRLAKSQTSQGKLAALKAYEADPYLVDANRTVWRLFQSSLDLADGQEANRWCAEGGRRFASDYRFTECKLWLLTLTEGAAPQSSDIWSAHDDFVKSGPEAQREFLKLKAGMIAAIALIRARLPDSARAVAARSQGTPEIDPARELTYLHAIVRAQLGDTDDAFRLLATYLATNPQQRATAGHDESWWLRDLQRDPRWSALIKN